MTEQKPNNPWPAVIFTIAALAFWLWPTFHGWEVSTWFGKVILRPAPAPVVVQPPKTRCLVFGFSTCSGCKQLHRTIRWDVQPHGWKVGSAPTDDIEEIDIYSNDRRIKQYRHSSYPTLIIVDQAEKEVSRREEPMTGPDLIAWIQSTR
jgi:hypothetical protein